MATRKKPSKRKKFLTTFFTFCSIALLCLSGLLAYYAYEKNTAVATSEKSTLNSYVITDPKSGASPVDSKSEASIQPVKYTSSEKIITLKFGDKTEVIDADMIREWQQNDNSESSWSDDKINDYAKYLANKYSNFTEYITFTDHNGKKQDVINKSTGWVLNEEKAAFQIKKLLDNKKAVALNLTDRSSDSNKWWTRIAGDYSYEQIKGDSFIEVSIDDQYMWVVKNDHVILESPIVTGNPYTEHDTPTGSYFISSKESPAILYGEGYETEVSYWMAFNYDIGFHDASWQDNFGGDSYYYNGSHGCVNLPLSFAKKLYENTYLNMPVYVY